MIERKYLIAGAVGVAAVGGLLFLQSKQAGRGGSLPGTGDLTSHVSSGTGAGQQQQQSTQLTTNVLGVTAGNAVAYGSVSSPTISSGGSIPSIGGGAPAVGFSSPSGGAGFVVAGGTVNATSGMGGFTAPMNMAVMNVGGVRAGPVIGGRLGAL